MSDDLLPDRDDVDFNPSRESDDGRLDFSNVPIRVSIGEESFDLSVGEALALVGRVSASLEVWFKFNER